MRKEQAGQMHSRDRNLARPLRRRKMVSAISLTCIGATVRSECELHQRCGSPSGEGSWENRSPNFPWLFVSICLPVMSTCGTSQVSQYS